MIQGTTRGTRIRESIEGMLPGGIVARATVTRDILKTSMRVFFAGFRAQGRGFLRKTLGFVIYWVPVKRILFTRGLDSVCCFGVCGCLRPWARDSGIGVPHQDYRI